MTNLINNKIFTIYKNCFFCDSKNLGDEINYNYNDNPYTKKLRIQNSLTIKDIQSNLRLRECNSCKSFTFDRWFKTTISKNIYNESKHRMGWYKFFNTIYNYNSSIIKEDLDLFYNLSNELGKVESYAELMCPFMGLLPLYSMLKNENENEKLFPSKISRLKIFIYKILKKKKIDNNIYNLLKNTKLHYKNIFFLQLDLDNKGWDKNCNFGGCNCKEIINKFNWVKKIDIAEFNKISDKIDILNLSNTLDHINKPMNTIVNLSSKFKNIYIDFHDHLTGGSQHSFFLTKKTINILEDKIKFFIKKKFSEQQYLLSRKS